MRGEEEGVQGAEDQDEERERDEDEDEDEIENEIMKALLKYQSSDMRKNAQRAEGADAVGLEHPPDRGLQHRPDGVDGHVEVAEDKRNKCAELRRAEDDPIGGVEAREAVSIRCSPEGREMRLQKQTTLGRQQAR
jgi:hypothetical protein